MKDITVKCYKCGKEYTPSDMRYSSINKTVCKNCLTSIGKKVAETKAKASAFKAVSSSVEYRCSGCKYTFKTKESTSRCPYCGKSGTLESKKSMDANSLLMESMDKKYEF